MNKSYRDTLLEILNIIAYPGDKEKFVTQFEELNFKDALVNTIEKLPHTVQEQIRACNNDHKKIQQIIPAEVYKEELINVYRDALIAFLESLA